MQLYYKELLWNFRACMLQWDSYCPKVVTNNLIFFWQDLLPSSIELCISGISIQEQLVQLAKLLHRGFLFGCICIKNMNMMVFKSFLRYFVSVFQSWSVFHLIPFTFCNSYLQPMPNSKSLSLFLTPLVHFCNKKVKSRLLRFRGKLFKGKSIFLVYILRNYHLKSSRLYQSSSNLFFTCNWWRSQSCWWWLRWWFLWRWWCLSTW